MAMAEFSVVPLDKGESVSAWIAKVMPIVEESGLDYKATPMATIVEGDLDKVMETIAACHKKMRGFSKRVITTIKIDDREGAKGRLGGKIASVEKHLGHELKK